MNIHPILMVAAIVTAMGISLVLIGDLANESNEEKQKIINIIEQVQECEASFLTSLTELESDVMKGLPAAQSYCKDEVIGDQKL